MSTIKHFKSSFFIIDTNPKSFQVNTAVINSESDTESISNESDLQNGGFVSSTSSASSIYDDKDIDLKVYQDANEWDKRSNSSSITCSNSSSSPGDEILTDNEVDESPDVVKRSVAPVDS